MRILREKVDWIRFPEVAYGDSARLSTGADAAEERWARSVLEVFETVVMAGFAWFYVHEHDHDHTLQSTRRSFHTSRGVIPLFSDSSELPPGAETILYPPCTVNTTLSIARHLSPTARDFHRGFLQRFDAADALGLVMHPTPGTVLALGSFHEKPIELTRIDRRRLEQVALHIETGYRLLKRPESVKATLLSNGRLEHREDDAPSAERLEIHGDRVVRARARCKSSAGDSLDLWTALVDGSVTLVPRRQGARVHYAVLENPIGSRTPRALSSCERDALSLAARGLSSKLIAYALGISEVSVSERLAAAASKIGLMSRLELVRIAALLTQDRRADVADAELTIAECEILELLQSGLSNRQIAATRARSVRTIANQVASILKKTQSATRRALVACPSTMRHAKSAPASATTRDPSSDPFAGP
jgi:DNA-binding NarL/FixJ family response regulator